MNDKIEFCGLGHINIVVDDIDEGISFYSTVLQAVPSQIFRNFKNTGFSKAAGFLSNAAEIELHIAFLDIPNTGLTLELMQYITPETDNKVETNEVYTIAGVRHVALKVNNIEQAFEKVSKMSGIELISSSENYKPYKIDAIQNTDFMFCDPMLECDMAKKREVVDCIGQTKYFYFRDKYGVQWEFEQGHTDVGNDR